MQFKAKFMFPLLLFAAVPINLDREKEFIVWNVGQGLWSTLVEPSKCLHFDMGGEYMPLKPVQELCYEKQNIIFLSHEDWDHIGFVKKVARTLPKTCLVPPHTTKKSFTKSLVKSLLPCPEIPLVQKIDLNFYKTTNDSSRIIETENILLPGDSTACMEKKWCYLLKGIDRVRVLVLGHHGSQTSTSQHLLDKLSHLKLSIASAREQRYGHPHAIVRKRLKKNGIPLLRTEDWGHIRIQLPL